jgi:hypothetical protein
MGAVKAGIPLVILLAGVYVFRDVFFSGPGIRRPRILASPALITRLEDEAAAVAKLQEALDKGENGQIESTYTTYLDNVNRYSDMLTKTNLDEEDRTRFASVQKLTAELNKKRACRETLLGIHEALKSLGYEPDIGLPQKEPNWRAQVDEWVDAHPESRLTMAKHEDLPPRDFVAVRGLFDPSVLPKDQANQVRALAPGSRPTILAVGDPGLEWGTDAAWDISRVIEAIEGKNSPFPDEAPPALFANGAVRLLNEMDLARLRSLTPKAPDNPPQAMPPESIERVLATFHTKVDRAGGVFRIELWATEPERKLIVESELPAEEWPKGSTRSVDNHVSQALPSGPVEATIRLITPSNARDIHWITDIRLEATTSKGRRLVWDHENARLGTVTGRRSLQLGPAMPQPQ